MNTFQKIEEQEIEAKNFGFYWENIDQLLKQIQSECSEVKDAWEKKDLAHLDEEIGDLLQAGISLAIFCGINAESSLAKSVQKFQKRYETVVSLAAKDGLNSLHDQPFEVLMKYWNQAKNQNNLL